MENKIKIVDSGIYLIIIILFFITGALMEISNDMDRIANRIAPILTEIKPSN